MKTAISALVLLATLAALALTLAIMAQAPTTVSLIWGSTTLSTQEPVAILLLFAIATALFYTGRLAGWMIGLPSSWFFRKTQLARQSYLTGVANGLIACENGNMPTAKNIAKNMRLEAANPSSPETQLGVLLKLSTQTLTRQEAETARSFPVVGPLVALFMARNAAQNQNWAEIRRLAAGVPRNQARPHHLTTLYFKALINLQDPEASRLLPEVEPLVGPSAFRLLSSLVQGMAPTQARQLDHVWVKAFQAWLPTPSDTFPVFHTDI